MEESIIVCHSKYIENFKYNRQQLNENFQDTFINRMHSQRLILNCNKTFCKDEKWTHVSHSKGTVADHYMITNYSSTKYVHCVRSEDVTAMLLMIQFYWVVMWC